MVSFLQLLDKGGGLFGIRRVSKKVRLHLSEKDPIFDFLNPFKKHLCQKL